MAAGTRSRENLEEGLRSTDSRMQELMNSHYQLQKSVEVMEEKFGHIQNTMEMIMHEIQRSRKGKNTANSEENLQELDKELLGNNEGSGVKMHNTAVNQHRVWNPKFEFPVFNGIDIRNWVLRCEYFFQLYPMTDEQRLKSVALNTDGEAGTWFLAYYKTHGNIPWTQFVKDIETRFGDSGHNDSLAEFNRLQQNTTVLQYQKRFEFLRSIVEAENPGLSEEYFIKCFIGGLKEEIGGMVKLLKPKKLTEAISVARVQENTVDALYKRTKLSQSFLKSASSIPQTELKPLLTGSKGSGSQVGNSAGNHNQSGTITEPFLKTNSSKVRKRTFNELQARKEKGLCFNCDEKYTVGHRCQNKQIFMIVGEDENEEEESDGGEQYELPPVEQATDITISLHALNGQASATTMRIKATVAHKEIFILIDTGSTHNFLNATTADFLKCAKEVDKPLQVSVADGFKMISNERCKDFTWKTQGYSFQTDMRIIPLTGCDAVLGVQWLKTLGDCIFNFELLTLTFNKDGKRVKLQGTRDGNGAATAMISANELVVSCKKDQLSVLAYLFSVSKETEETVPHEINLVLEEFSDVFQEPKTLPPQRSHDHHIPLQVGSDTFTIRPYRYPHVQKSS